MVPPPASPRDSTAIDSTPSSSRARDAVDRFISLWGDMASTWGVNRTMAKIHALLYCAEQPLNTDQIMERLDVSRGNANMNLRSLVDWDLVSKTQRAGSRKDFYRAEKDVWQITARIIEERQRREVQPVRERLQDCAAGLAGEDETIEDRPEAEQVLYRRFANLIELMEVFEGVSKALLPLVQEENVDQIEYLIGFAQALDDRDQSKSDDAS